MKSEILLDITNQFGNRFVVYKLTCHKDLLLELVRARMLSVHWLVNNQDAEVLIGGTEWKHFFKTRIKSKNLEVVELTDDMLENYENSITKIVNSGWHGPHFDQAPPGCSEQEAKDICALNCANLKWPDRYSYSRHPYFSPDFTELNRTACEFVVMPSPLKGTRSGNLLGFVQYRSQLEN